MSCTGPQPPPQPVLAVCGVMSNDDARGMQAVERLAQGFGGVDLRGDAQPFDNTDYYEPEMGSALQRCYCSFGELLPATQLVALKQRAWHIEQQLSASGRRVVNLDPGYLDLHKVVLASFKEGHQKLYLGQGVWADLVLFYQHGAFGPLRWTFPDLRDGTHLPFFLRARQRYKQLLRQLPDEPR